MPTQEQIQEKRYQRLREYIGDLEAKAYSLGFDATGEECIDMCIEAEEALGNVLAYYELSYFNPGEPVAEKETDDDKIVIPLTSADAGNNGGMRTDTEEEAELAAGTDLLDSELYWARLRLQQASDVLEYGWQYGLSEPPADEPFVLDDEED